MIYQDNHISFGEDDKEALRILVREILKPNSQIVEIGSWLGTGSTKVIIEELQAIGSGTLYCVDTWKGSENVAQHQEVVAHYDIFETFSHNVNLANGKAYVKPLMMSSKDAAAIIEDGSIDLVFIDGDHSYAAVTEDIALWKSKVRAGGILCGHDCECRPNGVLRDAILSSLDLDYIPGVGTFFEVVHPGVVLAVDEAFNGSANLWAETPFSRPNGVHGRATLWDNQQLSTITGPSTRPPIIHDTPLPHLVGAVSDYNIVLFAGVHYAAPQSLGALDLSQLDLASRPPEILVARSYDEIVLAITEVIEQEQERPIPHLVGTMSGYNIVLFAGAHYALPKSLGPLDLSQQDLSSMPPAILVARSYDEIVLAITAAIKPKAIKKQPIPHLVGAVSGYNIVLFAGVHYAVPQSLGALDLSQLDLPSRPPAILIARSYDEVVLAITAVIELEAIKKQPIPHLVGAVSGYNIVLFAGVHYAVPQSLGALDLSQLDLASRPPEILIGRSYDEAVLAISAVIKQEVIQEQPTST